MIDTPVEQAEAIESPRRTRPAPMVEVKVIVRNGPVVVVQWATKDDVARAWVPAEAVQNGKVSQQTLQEGQPYGVRWEEFLVRVEPVDVARALRRQNIWTVTDLALRLSDAVNIMNRPLLDVLRAAIRSAKKE